MINSIYAIPTPHATKRVTNIAELALGRLAIRGINDMGSEYVIDVDTRDYQLGGVAAVSNVHDPIQQMDHLDNDEFVYRIYLYYDENGDPHLSKKAG